MRNRLCRLLWVLLCLGLLAACGGSADRPAPQISAQPVADPVDAGGSLTLTVTASGSGPFTFQWLRNGTIIAGATGATLQLNALSGADDGAVITVTVTGPGGGSTTSAPVTLRVRPPVAPQISAQPADTAVTEGEDARFSVTAGGTAPLAYQWQRNGTPIAGATTATLQLTATALADSGALLTVQVSNLGGAVLSAPARLTVNPRPIIEAPRIVAAPVDQTVIAGAGATFSVAAIGAAPLDYQWFRNGTPIGQATAPSYTLANAQAADHGAVFTVRIGNAGGSVTSSGATLRVTPPPQPPIITAQPAGQTVTEGDDASFSVSATGDTPLAYQWLRNGTPIAGVTAATFLLGNAALRDDGALFSVRVSNAAGSVVSSAAELRVVRAPQPARIVTPPAALTVADGAAASFTVSAAGDAPLAYQWRRNGTPIAGATAPTLSFVAVGLADSGARFSVVVSNSFGSAASAEVTLTVNPVAPSITMQPVNATIAAGDPATFVVRAVGSAPLAYQWRRNGVDIAGATADSYVFSGATPADHGNRFSVRVSNLAGSMASSEAALIVTTAPSAPRRWGLELVLSPASDSPAQPRVAIGGAGDALAVWQRSSTLNPSARDVDSSYFGVAPAAGWSLTRQAAIGYLPSTYLGLVARSLGDFLLTSTWDTAAVNGMTQNRLYLPASGAWTDPPCPPSLFFVGGLVRSSDMASELAAAADGSAMMLVAREPEHQLLSVRTQIPIPGNPSCVDGGIAFHAVPLRVDAAPDLEERRSPSLARNGAGTSFAAWMQRDIATSERAIWANRFVPGSNWGAALRLSFPQAGDIYGGPSVAADAAGNATVVFRGRMAGRPTVHVARYRQASGTWSSIDTLDDSSCDVDPILNISRAPPQVAMDDTGRTTVAWDCTVFGQRRVLLRRFDTASLPGTFLNLQSALGPADSFLPVLAVNAAGDAVVTYKWRESTGSVRPGALHHLAGAWIAHQPIGATAIDPSDADELVRVAIDPGGNAAAVWRDAAGAIRANQFR